MVHPVVVAVARMASMGTHATVQEIVDYTGLSQVEVVNQMLSRSGYGQMSVQRDRQNQVRSASYIGAHVRGECNRFGIFVFDATGEPAAYPSDDLAGVHVEWVTER